MAKTINNISRNGFALTAPIERQNAVPTDTTYMHATFQEAQNYAKTGVTAYVGQIIYVQATNKHYKISNEAGTLEEIGGGEDTTYSIETKDSDIENTYLIPSNGSEQSFVPRTSSLHSCYNTPLKSYTAYGIWYKAFTVYMSADDVSIGTNNSLYLEFSITSNAFLYGKVYAKIRWSNKELSSSASSLKVISNEHDLQSYIVVTADTTSEHKSVSFWIKSKTSGRVGYSLYSICSEGNYFEKNFSKLFEFPKTFTESYTPTTEQQYPSNVFINPKLFITASSTPVGSATQPVYISTYGHVTACTYSLGTNVPSNAKFTDTTYSAATTSAAGLISAADKTKLDGIATGANNYSLPIATSDGLGGVKIGTTLTSTSGYTPVHIYDDKIYYKNTTYSSEKAASGGTTLSLVTTGEKYTWNNKSNLTIGTTATTAAAGNHTHNYLPLSGGTLIGTLHIAGSESTTTEKNLLTLGYSQSSNIVSNQKSDGTESAVLSIISKGGDTATKGSTINITAESANGTYYGTINITAEGQTTAGSMQAGGKINLLAKDSYGGGTINIEVEKPTNNTSNINLNAYTVSIPQGRITHNNHTYTLPKKSKNDTFAMLSDITASGTVVVETLKNDCYQYSEDIIPGKLGNASGGIIMLVVPTSVYTQGRETAAKYYQTDGRWTACDYLGIIAFENFINTTYMSKADGNNHRVVLVEKNEVQIDQ